MRVLIIILIFFTVFPIFPIFLPVPTDRIIQVIALCYFILNPVKAKFFFQNKYTLKVFFLSFLVFIIAFLLQVFSDGGLDLNVGKDALKIIGVLISSCFICSLMAKYYKDFSLIKFLEILVFVFFIQALISFIFFFIPSIFDTYMSFLNPEVNKGLIMRSGLLHTRLIGVGNAFFNGVMKYGVVLIVLVHLSYIKGSFFYQKRVFYYLSYLLLCFAGVLTGRTFFVAILLTLIVILVNEIQNPIKFLFRSIRLPLLVLILGLPLVFFFENNIDQNRLENISNFVFELFINLSEEGEVSTSSSDKTLEMYVFPEETKTWLIGDGKFINDDGSYYMRTDVGYLRYIYYFGLLGTIIFFLVQFKYLKYLQSLTKIKELKSMYLILLLWILILNFKGIAYLDIFVASFVAASLLNNGGKFNQSE